jgi:hypothetical protein
MVWLAPLFTVYVTVALAVPVKVKTALVSEQTGVLAQEAVAVGSIIVNVTD